MTIEQIELRILQIPLKQPFETSFGRFIARECIFVSAYGDGAVGYAECIAMSTPFYNEETTGTAWHLLHDFFIPTLLRHEVEHPRQVAEILSPFRGNFMALSALESAIWELYCQQQGISLSKALGGTRDKIEVGVSIGIEPSIEHVLDNVARFVDEGYRKIKVKIKPGFDIKLIEAIRNQFGPDLLLMADANSAYTLDEIPIFQELDQYGLLMIEQPLSHDDIIDHAKLQAKIDTPICLDESILTVDDARHAIELGSCRTINIKTGRVGGLTHAKAIHDLCAQHGMPVWCGGMFEMGVGKAHNIALASLPNFSIPGDTSPSKRHWMQDLVVPAIDFCEPGYLAVPEGPGMGYTLNHATLNQFTIRHETITAS
jgi:O-succinylbenzoate synthase